MHNKLIAAGTGLFSFGALVGWAVTGDYFERKMKNNQQLLGEVIAKQSQTIHDLQFAELISYAEEDVKSTEHMFRAKARMDEMTVEDLTAESPLKPLTEEVLSTEETILEYLLPEEPKKKGPKVVKPNLYSVPTTDAKNEVENSPGEDSGETNVTDGDEEVDEEKTEATRANLQRLIDNYTMDPDQVEQFVNTATRTQVVDRTPPFVISREKYSWDEEEGDAYAKITLTYYPTQRILLDDEEDVIEDVNNTVGWRSLSQFGGESGDPDVVFVRNRYLMTDFEVVREEDSELPLHIKYGMSRDEFETNKAAGVIKFRPGDQ